MSSVGEYISIKGASEHNLKSINLKIKRNEITVVTGVSGSGKSSLVFDTILSEAQRRFFYTLSHYTRQFLDLSTRPKVHAIKGLSPAIALAQTETPPSIRSTVGTLTDMAELLGVLFARFGKKHCPIHGFLTEEMSIKQIETLFFERFKGKIVAICAPIVEHKKGTFANKLNSFAEKGYIKICINGVIVDLTNLPQLEKEQKHTIKLVVDYISVSDATTGRLHKSLLLALEEGRGSIQCIESNTDGTLKANKNWESFSTKGGCPSCGYSWQEIDSRYFSVNSLGRCTSCNGLGFIKEEETSLSSFSKLDCSECLSTGLSEKLGAITFKGFSLIKLNQLSIDELLEVFSSAGNVFEENLAYRRVHEEIISLLKRIKSVGLGYLNLSRRVRSLSGGESSRLKLSGILSEQLRGVLYILDEPSQGLHPLEIASLSKVLKNLKKLGNTVIVVDHDEHLMKHAADKIIDLGPGGGANGGQIVAQFSPKNAINFACQSATARLFIQGYGSKRTSNKVNPEKWIELSGASLNNLKGNKACFLRKGLTVVSGLSGSGKSSLVIHTLYPALKAFVSGKGGLEGELCFDSLTGVEHIKEVILIDRKPLAKSSVSMVVTYLDVLTPLRNWYAQLPEAQINGLSARSFSLQVEGGRCRECKGRGEVLLSMKFLSDARVRCELCGGKRFKEEVLNVKYKNKNLYDVLEMTVSDAFELFSFHPLVKRRLNPAIDMGLGYLKLGQSTATLSGGENQRLKLIRFLDKKKGGDGLVFILDEPTRGLHSHDVENLLKVFSHLSSQESSVICIEHSVEVIKSANHLIEIGPGSAIQGGNIIYQGQVKGVAKIKESKIKDFL